jgi:hypothetical protein
MKNLFSRVDIPLFALRIGCNLIAVVPAYAIAMIGVLVGGLILGKLDLIVYNLFCTILDNCKNGYGDYLGSENGGGEYFVGDLFAVAIGATIFLVLLLYSQRKISGILWSLIKDGVK